MKNNSNTSKMADSAGEFGAFHSLKPPYTRSQQDVWAAIEGKIGNRQEAGRVVPFYSFKNGYMRLAVAAVLVVLFAIPLFMNYYSVSVQTKAGEHTAVLLPDGSSVTLNAMSAIKYYPYKWSLSRRVELKGEAFFEVTKGKSFTVYSQQGSTRVLGTSFNVFARNAEYNVACVTGKVEVTDYKVKVIIEPNQSAGTIAGKGLVKNAGVNTNAVVAWKNNEFFYTSAALTRVMNDIELQYGIKFQFDAGVNTEALLYTGNFKKDKSVENVLNLVLKPFGLEHAKRGEGQYIVTLQK